MWPTGQTTVPNRSLPPQLPPLREDTGCAFIPGEVYFYFSHFKNCYFHEEPTLPQQENGKVTPESLGFSF